MADLRRRAKRWWPDWRSWPARLVSHALVPMPIRMRVLGAMGHRFAPKARIRPGTLVLGSGLTLGRDTFVNTRCLIDATAEVVLGDDVHLAHGVMILTADHEHGAPSRRAGTMIARPVRVGDGAWLGAACVLLPGVTVGEGCVVAAGAVVAEDLPPHGLYGGVPARLIRELES